MWGARRLWNSFISRFIRVFPISHKRHWLWGHDDTLHWEMVSKALNASQELITQVLSSCWKWQEGQEDSGWLGAEAGEPAWLSLLRSGQAWYCDRESRKIGKEQWSGSRFTSDSDFKCLSREDDGVEQLSAARSSCQPMLCPGREVWRTSSCLSATN